MTSLGVFAENVVKCKSHFIYNIDLKGQIQKLWEMHRQPQRDRKRYNLLAFENNQKRSFELV